MNKLQNFIEVNIFWIIAAVSIAVLFTNIFYTPETWNINRTIGWGWDISNFIGSQLSSLTGALPIFTIGYGIQHLRSKRANFILSTLYLLLLFIEVLLSTSSGMHSMFIVSGGWVVFILNFILSKK